MSCARRPTDFLAKESSTPSLQTAQEMQIRHCSANMVFGTTPSTSTVPSEEAEVVAYSSDSISNSADDLSSTSVPAQTTTLPHVAGPVKRRLFDHDYVPEPAAVSDVPVYASVNVEVSDVEPGPNFQRESGKRVSVKRTVSGRTKAVRLPPLFIPTPDSVAPSEHDAPLPMFDDISSNIRQFMESLLVVPPRQRRSRSSSVASGGSIGSTTSEHILSDASGRSAGKTPVKRLWSRGKHIPPPASSFKIRSTSTSGDQVVCDYVVVPSSKKPSGKDWLYQDLIWTHKRRDNNARKGRIHVVIPTGASGDLCTDGDPLSRAYMAVFKAITHLNAKVVALPYLGQDLDIDTRRTVLIACATATSPYVRDHSELTSLILTNATSISHALFVEYLRADSVDINAAQVSSMYAALSAHLSALTLESDNNVVDMDFEDTVNRAIETAASLSQQLCSPAENRKEYMRQLQHTPSSQERHARLEEGRFAALTPEQQAARREQNKRNMYRARHDPRRRLGDLSGELPVDSDDPLVDYPRRFHLGAQKKCDFCAALTFTFNCCLGGKVRLPSWSPFPQPLRDLITGAHPLSKQFKKVIVRYNTGFAMSCLVYQGVAVPQGEQIMKIEGTIQYQVSSVLRTDAADNVPMFGQLYAYSPDEAAAYRAETRVGSSLNREILLMLSKMFYEHNVLSRQFKKMNDILKDTAREQHRDLLIKLHSFSQPEVEALQRADAPHPGTLRQPEELVVASMLYQTTQSGAPLRSGIYVNAVYKGDPHFLAFWNPLVEPLFFPLLFPFGQDGFRYGEHKYAPYQLQQDVEEEDPEEDVPEEEQHVVQQDTVEEIEEDVSVDDNEAGDISRPPPPSLLIDDDDDHMNMDDLMDADEIHIRTMASELVDELAAIGVRNRGDGIWSYPLVMPSDADLQRYIELAARIRSTIRRIDSYSDHYCGDNELGPRNPDCVFDDLGAIIDHVYQRIADNDVPSTAPIIREAPTVQVPSFADYRQDVETSGEQAERCDEDGAVCSTGKKQENVSRRCYDLYHMQTRDKAISPICQAERLGQLFVVNQAIRLDLQRHENARQHLLEFCGTDAHTLQFRYRQILAEKQNAQLGFNFRLPESMPGSPAYYRCKFEDAMAMIHTVGKPDLFITFTGNNKWEEITSNLAKGTTWTSNPFLVNDVFKRKLEELLKEIVDRQLFGPVVGYCLSIEFQKRGMPHAHILITLDKDHKLNTPAKIDNYISATIPEIPKKDDPHYSSKMRYYENVRNFMFHKPCEGDKQSYCNQRPPKFSGRQFARCTKMFPHDFADYTTICEDGSAVYARPRDGRHFVMKNTKGDLILDGSANNRYVVAHNKRLLNLFECHINVECVSEVQVVKYLFKYLYKGFDRALLEFIENSEMATGEERGIAQQGTVSGPAVLPSGMPKNGRVAKRIVERVMEELAKRGLTYDEKSKKCFTAYDEAIILEEMRQMTPNEAAWKIQGYYLSKMSHTVETIGVHNENAELVCFRKNGIVQAAEKACSGKPMSALTAWFELNQVDVRANEYTYNEIPKHYILKKTNGAVEWIRKKREVTRLVVRVRPVNVRFLDTFAIRLLAMNRRGITSFEELRTVTQPPLLSIVHDTYEDAARALGLMNNQAEYQLALSDAAGVRMPKQLRRMFATILLFGDVTDPRELWDMFKEDLMDRPPRSIVESAQARVIREARALYHIASIIRHHQKTLADFHIDDTLVGYLTPAQKMLADDVQPENNIQVQHAAEAERREQQLTREQKTAYDVIVAAALDDKRSQNCFFLAGSGGCGKTFLYHAIYHRLMKEGKKIEMVAHTGIASTLLIKGTTAHRRFMLRLNTEENDLSNMRLESAAADSLRSVDVIIYDEATMSDINMFSAIDRLLRDIMRSDLPFGGKLMLLGGDWKQLLPVDAGRSAVGAVNLTLKKSPLWRHFKTLYLTRNMRASGDPAYAALLERIGNGYDGDCKSTRASIGYPDQSEIPCKTPEEVIAHVYGGDQLTNIESLKKSCLLASLNREAHEMNKKVLEGVPGFKKVYTAVDTPIESVGMQAPPEYFAEQMESGMPPYHLELKNGAIVILLRNLNVARGLCNGTRMLVTEMRPHFIRCTLLSTSFAGEETFIPKCLLSPAHIKKDRQDYTRFQFPLRLAYAMTINKSQGQTFERVGIILHNNVFAHGQLYVAMSRCTSGKNVRLYTYDKAHWLVDEKDNNMLRVVRPVNKVEHSILEPFDPIALTHLPSISEERSFVTVPVGEEEQQQSADISFEEPQEQEITAITPPAPEQRSTTDNEAIVEDVTVAANLARRPSVSPSHQPSTSTPSASSQLTSFMPIRTRQPSLISRFARETSNPNEHKHLCMRNPGSNCFMNAGVQCLRRLYDIAPQLTASRPGPGRAKLANLLMRFMQTSGTKGTVALRNQLGSVFPEFATRAEALRTNQITQAKYDAGNAIDDQKDVNEFITFFIQKIAPDSVEQFFTVQQQTTNTCAYCRLPSSANSVTTHSICEGVGEIVDPAAAFDCTNPDVQYTCRNPTCPMKNRVDGKLRQRRVTTPLGRYMFFEVANYDPTTLRPYDHRFRDPAVVDCLIVGGSKWRMVAAVRHIFHGDSYAGGGHFLAFTRDDEQGWWLHDDASPAQFIDALPLRLPGLCNMFYERIE